MTIKTTTPWYVFGNKFKMTKILLNEFSETKFNYIMNEDLYNVKISDSINSVKWEFNFNTLFF
ncbi:MAG: hypothetical protein Ct9H90mP17_1860 [Actinomycetota bacterium]|nr:MAG: hypothetical protein Ct9H90mP17_1860 [Actinomycetota bacterium]